MENNTEDPFYDKEPCGRKCPISKMLKATSWLVLVALMASTIWFFVELVWMPFGGSAKAEALPSITRTEEQRVEWIMDHAYPKLNADKRAKYRHSIMKWSAKYDLCPVTVASIIWKESKFDEKCKYLGALGPMQTIPRYHRDRMAKAGISVGDICTIDKGVHIGCIVFKHYMDKSKGNVHMALKRYNGCVNAKNPKYVRDVIGMRDRSKSQRSKKL